MSRRERILALTVIGLIGLFALDQLAVRPLMHRYDQLNARAGELESQLRSARMLLENRETIESRWRAMAAGGLGGSASAQRIAVQQRLTRWAEDAEFNLATVSTGQTTERGAFHETRFMASGSGSLRAVAMFLAYLEQGDYPLRIIESDVSSRNGGGDDLSLRLTLSTIRRADDGAMDADMSEVRP